MILFLNFVFFALVVKRFILYYFYVKQNYKQYKSTFVDI